MSVFLYERCDERERAFDLANRAFDEAVANVNETNEESFKNCTTILQLLKDNITLWSDEWEYDFIELWKIHDVSYKYFYQRIKMAYVQQVCEGYNKKSLMGNWYEERLYPEQPFREQQAKQVNHLSM